MEKPQRLHEKYRKLYVETERNYMITNKYSKHSSEPLALPHHRER